MQTTSRNGACWRQILFSYIWRNDSRSYSNIPLGYARTTSYCIQAALWNNKRLLLHLLSSEYWNFRFLSALKTNPVFKTCDRHVSEFLNQTDLQLHCMLLCYRIYLLNLSRKVMGTLRLSMTQCDDGETEKAEKGFVRPSSLANLCMINVWIIFSVRAEEMCL